MQIQFEILQRDVSSKPSVSPQTVIIHQNWSKQKHTNWKQPAHTTCIDVARQIKASSLAELHAKKSLYLNFPTYNSW